MARIFISTSSASSALIENTQCNSLSSWGNTVNPTVRAFLVHWLIPQMQLSSIKGFLACVQFHLRCLDPSTNSLLGNPFIKLLLNGFIKRNHKASLSLHHLAQNNHTLKDGCFGSYTDSLLETVSVTALNGSLRCGEFTTRTDR